MRKNYWQNISKSPKNPILGAIFGLFYLNFSTNEFSCKKKTQIIYYRAKNQKKLMSHSWEKCRTHGQTNRQRWFYRNLGGTEVLLVLRPCKSITYHITLKSWVKGKHTWGITFIHNLNKDRRLCSKLNS